MKLKFQYSDHFNKVRQYCYYDLNLYYFMDRLSLTLKILNPSPEAINALFVYINDNQFIVDLDDEPAIGDDH